MRSVLWSPELNQTIRALCSEDPNWTKWFVLCVMKSRSEPNESRSALWSPELNQMNRALKSRTEPNESRFAFWSPELNQMNRALRSEVPTEPNDSRSEVPNWTKWITLCALKSRLNQINGALCSEDPNWTKLITLCVLKTRTEPSDSCALCSEVPNWTKRSVLCVLKTQTEPNDSCSALWSPEVKQMNRALKPRTEPNELRS